LCLRYRSFVYRLHNRLEGGGGRGEGCHPSDLLCWLTVIWSGPPPLIPWGGGSQNCEYFAVFFVGNLSKIGANPFENNHNVELKDISDEISYYSV
jgi:hypothetical protein